MATADQLVELMFSWIEQRENCAKQLKKLADELKKLREKCNGAECIGSTASVIGAASLIGAGVATFFTAGAAAPFLAVLGGVYGGVGAAVSVGTKIIEHFSSSDTLKDAEKIEEKNNEIAERIQNLFEQLKVEVKRKYPSADPDQVDRHVMALFMGAVARRSGLKLNISFNQHEIFYPSGLGIRQNSLNTSAMAAGLTAFYGIFTVFSLKTAGKQSKLLIAEATKQLIKEMSAAGLKTAIKGGAMVVGGAVGMGFALPEAIDNWKDMVKKNHETEASRSLRDTADDILKNCSTLRKQFDDMRTALEEMARRQREEEEKEKARRQQEEWARRQQEEWARRQQEEWARRQQEEMARRQQEEWARRQQEQWARRQQEEWARRQQEEMARRQREEEEKARRQQEEWARRQREEEVMAKRRTEEEENAKKQIEEEKEKARRQREEEVMAKRRTEEEEKAKKQIEEEKEKARRQREEEVMAKRRTEEEEKAKKQIEEEKEKARRQREEEVMAKRRTEEEEKAKKQIEEKKEKARRRQEYEMLIRQQKPKEKLIGKKNNQQIQNPVQVKCVNLMTPTDQRHETKQCDQSEQTGREQQTNSQQTGGEQEKNSQQTGGEQEKNSQQAEQTGGDQGDDERDDEDKEKDQEEEESDSEEESEEEESNQTGRKKKTKRRRKNKSQRSNRQIQTVDQSEIHQTPPGTIRIGLLNTRSMNQRPSRISELITGHNLDVFLTSETWLTVVTAVRVLREASPEGFNFHYQVRTDGRRGGGVANQFSERLQGEQIHFDSLNITTFEFVVTELRHDDWSQPVVIINLYHPPGYNQQRFRRFLNEFQSLLDEVRQNYSSFIVAGDFNIHVNEERRSYTDEFDFLLWDNNLTQHVEEPTHRGGNTLDLVITSNVEISGLIVQDDGISDHSTLYINAKPKDTTDKTEQNENEEQKRFRKTEE